MSQVHRYVFLALLMLFVVACTPVLERGQPNYRVGTEGINFEFITFPEYEVQENDQFDVEIEMHNNGAYNSRNVVVFFDANPPNAVTLLPESEESKIKQLRYENGFKGRSEEIPLGDVKALNIFQIKANPLDKYYGNQREVTFSADICYDYSTLATPNVCVGNKSRSPLDCKTDENNEIRFDYPEGQGSPIVVSTVVEKIKSEDGKIIPYFEITVENFGEGETFVNKEFSEVGYLNWVQQTLRGEVKDAVAGGPLYLGATDISGLNAGSCRNSNLRYDDAVLMYLQLSDFKDEDFTCTNMATFDTTNNQTTKMFKLREGRAVLVCQLSKGVEPSQTAFYSPLIIKLFYNYKLTLAETASIVSADFEEENN